MATQPILQPTKKGTCETKEILIKDLDTFGESDEVEVMLEEQAILRSNHADGVIPMFGIALQFVKKTSIRLAPSVLKIDVRIFFVTQRLLAPAYVLLFV